jgi:hypothetical protein
MRRFARNRRPLAARDQPEILAWHTTGGASNGPTEAVNLAIKNIKRVGRGFAPSPTTACGCCCTAAASTGKINPLLVFGAGTTVGGVEPLKKFREHAFAESDRQIMARAMDPKNGEYILANATYWFEHELRQYPAVDLDLDGLKAHAERIVPVAGRASRGHPAYEVNVELGKKLGGDLIELPGGHVGYVSQPAEFAREFVQALARTGHGPKA